MIGIHQNMELRLKLAFSLLILISPSVLSCSAPPGKPSISEAYESNENVYLAFAQSIDTKESKDKVGNKIILQSVIFRVLESWKGNYKVGQELTFQTTILDGSCGVGATNEPVWLEEEPVEGKPNSVPNHPRLSGIWVIYENSSAKHQLTFLGRTSPLELGGSEDLKALYQLQRNKSGH
jgi:hypothetical protein